jgi:hypothetical protein
MAIPTLSVMLVARPSIDSETIRGLGSFRRGFGRDAVGGSNGRHLPRSLPFVRAEDGGTPGGKPKERATIRRAEAGSRTRPMPARWRSSVPTTQTGEISTTPRF